MQVVRVTAYHATEVKATLLIVSRTWAICLVLQAEAAKCKEAICNSVDLPDELIVNIVGACSTLAAMPALVLM